MYRRNREVMKIKLQRQCNDNEVQVNQEKGRNRIKKI